MYEFLDYQVQDVMTRNPTTVSPETRLADLDALLEKHGFNGAPVVDADGALVGWVTKLDVLKAFRFDDDHMFPPYATIMESPVHRVMVRDVNSATPRMPLTRLLERLVSMRVKSLPVLDDDRLVGVVAREDVLGGLRRAASGLRPGAAEDGGD